MEHGGVGKDGVEHGGIDSDWGIWRNCHSCGDYRCGSSGSYYCGRI